MKTYLKTLNKGFTLMELLIVMAVMAILMAIVLPNLNNARVRGRDARRVADIKNIQLALAVYYDAHRTEGYPLDIYSGSLAPIYIPVMPKDPLGSNYPYSALAGTGTSCPSYHLGAIFEGNSSVLTEDGDFVSASKCSTSANDFHGNATNCSGTTAATPDRCYDVKP